MKKFRRLFILIAMVLACTLCACSEYAAMGTGIGLANSYKTKTKSTVPDAEKYYYDLKNVVLYLDTYGELPLNYITKKEAKKRGWEGGSVEKYVKDAARDGEIEKVVDITPHFLSDYRAYKTKLEASAV